MVVALGVAGFFERPVALVEDKFSDNPVVVEKYYHYQIF
jgi:hypothetical protein